MWEKISKVLIVNVIALIIIITCSVITLVVCFYPLPPASQDLVKLYFNMGLLGVVGWAFTQMKTKSS
jgi:hypothetical protein